MSQALFDKIESEQYRKNPLEFSVGDTVRVHTRVVEGDKERIQVFAGIVIGRRGRGLNATFTVRRISYGEGVERVFPVNSPRIEKVEVERYGKVRRAKLTYLRKRIGKAASTVKEKERVHTGKKKKGKGKAKTPPKAKAKVEAKAEPAKPTADTPAETPEAKS